MSKISNQPIQRNFLAAASSPGVRSPERYREIGKVHAALRTLHPQLFDIERPRPLALGIHRELSQAYPDVGSDILNGALEQIVGGRAYLKSCVRDAQRWGLNGPSGVVTENESQYAAERLKNFPVRMPKVDADPSHLEQIFGADYLRRNRAGQ